MLTISQTPTAWTDVDAYEGVEGLNILTVQIIS